MFFFPFDSIRPAEFSDPFSANGENWKDLRGKLLAHECAAGNSDLVARLRGLFFLKQSLLLRGEKEREGSDESGGMVMHWCLRRRVEGAVRR